MVFDLLDHAFLRWPDIKVDIKIDPTRHGKIKPLRFQTAEYIPIRIIWPDQCFLLNESPESERKCPLLTRMALLLGIFYSRKNNREPRQDREER